MYDVGYCCIMVDFHLRPPPANAESVELALGERAFGLASLALPFLLGFLFSLLPQEVILQ